MRQLFALCLMCVCIAASPLHAQSAMEKALVVCDTAPQARQYVEVTQGLEHPTTTKSPGCHLRHAEYNRGAMVDSLPRNGRFFKIIEVTLTKVYDRRGMPVGIRYSVVYPIDPPPLF